ELLEDGAPARVLGLAGGVGIEIEAAAFSGDRHPQRVAREHQLGGDAVDRRNLAPGPALLAGAVDLHHRLGRLEIERAGNLLHERLDVRAQEFGGGMAGTADEVEVPRVAVGRLEARAPLAEVDLARDAGVDHPLQRAVNGGAADAGGLLADAFEQIVGADVPFLAQEDLHDAIALAGAFAAG